MLVQMYEKSGAIAAARPLDSSGDPLGRSDHALLSIADAGRESRCVVFVPGALDLACALIRHGVSEVTIARLGDRHPAAKADLVIVPDAGSRDYLERVIPCARRMLMPLSTLVIRIGQDGVNELSLGARRLLVLHGFSAIRTRAVNGDVVLRAEMPLCGRATCA